MAVEALLLAPVWRVFWTNTRPATPRRAHTPAAATPAQRLVSPRSQSAARAVGEMRDSPLFRRRRAAAERSRLGVAGAASPPRSPQK